MSSSVPSVEDITNAFPTPITTITGKPNYESLKTLKDQLKANAASIPTTLGGGNHGYLGLIFSPAAYATIAATHFIEPIYPGQHPNIPAGTSPANTSTIIRRHTEDLRQWREFKNVNTALKNQLLSALDDIYIRALKDSHVGYMNQSIRTILQHLFDNYGNITPLEQKTTMQKCAPLGTPTDLSIVLTEVWILQGICPLKDEWVFGCSLKTRLADQTKTQQLKWLWSNDTKDSTINQRLVEQIQEETLS